MHKKNMFEQGICLVCNKNLQQSKGKKNGKTVYRARCSSCHNKKYRQEYLERRKNRKRPYRSFIDDLELVCERCGFEAEHKCQMDVHHKDYNHDNNSLDNLELLCSNCHRLEHLS